MAVHVTTTCSSAASAARPVASATAATTRASSWRVAVVPSSAPGSWPALPPRQLRKTRCCLGAQKRAAATQLGGSPPRLTRAKSLAPLTTPLRTEKIKKTSHTKYDDDGGDDAADRVGHVVPAERHDGYG